MISPLCSSKKHWRSTTRQGGFKSCLDLFTPKKCRRGCPHFGLSIDFAWLVVFHQQRGWNSGDWMMRTYFLNYYCNSWPLYWYLSTYFMGIHWIYWYPLKRNKAFLWDYSPQWSVSIRAWNSWERWHWDGHCSHFESCVAWASQLTTWVLWSFLEDHPRTCK